MDCNDCTECLRVQARFGRNLVAGFAVMSFALGFLAAVVYFRVAM